MSQTPHQTLHQELVALHDRAKAWLEGEKPEDFDPMLGICHNLPEQCDGDLLGGLMADWPGGTGGRDYPVPHPVKRPGGAYTHASASEMWEPQFEYARNRWALLEWLIEQTASEADQ